jgi:cytochrome c5
MRIPRGEDVKRYRFLLLAAVAFLVPTHLTFATDLGAIAERLQRAGDVCIAGDGCAGVAVQTTAASGASAGGPEGIYKGTCSTCHDLGVAGAPRLGDSIAWAPRIEAGMDSLYGNSMNGLNAMPPKGLCMTCSAEELQAVVDYMVDTLK